MTTRPPHPGIVTIYEIANIDGIDYIAMEFVRGSRARDTWIHTSAGWRRRKHEKLTINEQMIDGHAAKQ